MYVFMYSQCKHPHFQKHTFYFDVINQEMSRDPKSHPHVVKQVKFLLIPSKIEQKVILY